MSIKFRDLLSDKGPRFSRELKRELDVERILSFSSAMPFIAAGNAFNSLLLAGFLWLHTGAAQVLLWIIPFQCIVLLQLLHWNRNRHRPRPHLVSPAAVQRIIHWSLLSGGLWGAICSLNIADGDCMLLFVLGLVAAGLSASSVTVLHRLPAAAIGFVLCALVPPIVLIGSHSGVQHLLIAFLGLSFICFLVFAVRNSFTTFLETIELKQKNAWLLERAE